MWITFIDSLNQLYIMQRYTHAPDVWQEKNSTKNKFFFSLIFCRIFMLVLSFHSTNLQSTCNENDVRKLNEMLQCIASHSYWFQRFWLIIGLFLRAWWSVADRDADTISAGVFLAKYNFTVWLLYNWWPRLMWTFRSFHWRCSQWTNYMRTK